MEDERKEASKIAASPKERFVGFVKEQWPGLLVGAVVSIVIGVFISYSFYFLSLSERIPLFQVEKQRSLIVDTTQTSTTAIKIVRRNGELVKGNVWLVRFHFWNDGKKPIKSGDILEPLGIGFTEEIEILEHSITSTSRPIVNALLENSPNSPFSLRLSFKILEQKDVITGQIIYVGNEDDALTLNGTIEGVKNIGSDRPISVGNSVVAFWVGLIGFFGQLLPVLLLFLVLVSIMVVIALAEKYLPNPFKSRLKKALFILIGCSFALFMLYGLYTLGKKTMDKPPEYSNYRQYLHPPVHSTFS